LPGEGFENPSPGFSLAYALSAFRRKLAVRNSQGHAISAISQWELTMMGHRERIRITLTLESFLREVEARFNVLPISASVCAQAMALPESYPKNPADRLIGATALVDGIRFVTADRDIRRSRAVQTIW
jgi:PIN domain nuclease of toxin-antitoxin system